MKVSDGEGRLIPPDTGRETVGDSFSVDVQGIKLGQLDVAEPTGGGDEPVL